MTTGWKIRRIGEICDILDSRRKPVTKSKRQAGNIPYYGATGVQDYVNDYIFDGRYLLVGEDGAKWGKNDNTAYIIEGKSWVNNHAHVLRVHDDTIDCYVRYYLNGRDLNPYITGAIVPKLTQAALVSIPIPVPPFPDQERIVSELDLLSEIIDKQKAQLKELDNLAQSIFYDMFGDPVENEKGWEVKKLGSICDIGSGGTPSKKVNEFWEEGVIPWIGSNMCQNKVIYETDGKFITQLGLDHSSAKLLPIDTVIIALVGATIGKVGLLKTGCSTNQNIAFAKPSSKINCYFLFYVIMNLYRLFLEIGNGKFRMANLAFINNLPIILPPLTLQQQFAEKIERIEKQKEAITRSIADTQQLFDYTMDKYFG